MSLHNSDPFKTAYSLGASLGAFQKNRASMEKAKEFLAREEARQEAMRRRALAQQQVILGRASFSSNHSDWRGVFEKATKIENTNLVSSSSTEPEYKEPPVSVTQTNIPCICSGTKRFLDTGNCKDCGGTK